MRTETQKHGNNETTENIARLKAVEVPSPKRMKAIEKPEGKVPAGAQAHHEAHSISRSRKRIKIKLILILFSIIYYYISFV